MNSTALAKGVSVTLISAGGITFILGDSVLRKIWQVNFLSAELLGIGWGLLLMFLGGAIQFAISRFDSKANMKDKHKNRV